ncbi:hypothetical protein OS493_031370 [Desmophyllum pertusum]|uniref:Uncharacterized protein n=1 Tax=Desmophyllum pertusum TaxID=174260 RepID=A0A9W9YMJ6_9CNID|nr:hypothetical protein OS493_031370 [Desmophyllum pertusum]
MSDERRKRLISFWVLLNFIHVSPFVRANDVSYCVKKTTYHNVVLQGGLEAGVYKPWGPGDLLFLCEVPFIGVVLIGEDHSTSDIHTNHSHCFQTQPQSSSSKKTQKEQKEPIMSRQNPPRRRVMDSDEEMGRKSKLFRFFSRKHNPHTALLLRYAVCFFLGGLVGLIPYLVFVIELCKANLEMRNPHLPSLNGYSKTKDGPKSEAITTFSGISSESTITTANIGINFTTPGNVSSTGPTTPRPTRVVKTEKKAEGTANDDISLQCPGTITVIRVRAFGIPGDGKTVEDFNKHCQANLGRVDGTNVCIVSLKRVYKSSYPPFIKTLVTYTCSYTEHVN